MKTVPSRSLFLLAGLALGACASDKQSRTDAPPPVNAGLTALDEPSGMAGRLKQDARDLQALLNQTPEPPTPRASRTRLPDPTPSAATEPPPVEAPAAALTPAPTVTPEPAPPPLDLRTPDQRFADALRELAAQLRERLNTSPTPWPDAMLLSAIAATHPAALPGFQGELNSSGSALVARLSPPELRSLTAASTLLTDWAGQVTQASDPGSPARAADLLASAAKSLSGAASVRLPVATLCTRVEGFGQYDPVPTLTFSAGKAVRAVLYVEVDGLSHQAHTTPGNWAVELTQEVRVIHDADGSLQWYKPEQRVLDVSRNQRRDFFLVQPIDLPQTLSVGNYTLRVTVRDLGPTRQGRAPDQAEATVKFAVVADSSAARGR